MIVCVRVRRKIANKRVPPTAPTYLREGTPSPVSRAPPARYSRAAPLPLGNAHSKGREKTHGIVSVSMSVWASPRGESYVGKERKRKGDWACEPAYDGAPCGSALWLMGHTIDLWTRWTRLEAHFSTFTMCVEIHKPPRAATDALCIPTAATRPV